jgi:excisionase family DNA binding protein
MTPRHSTEGGTIVMTAISDLPASTGPRLLLTVPEAAAALAISRSKLYELLTAGIVPSIRIDGSRRIPITALHTYIATLLTEAA